MAAAHQIDDRGCICTFRIAPFSRRGFVAGAALVLAAAAVRTVGAVEAIPAIAAAADLNYALREIADHFSKDTGKDVRLSFGSSGDFTTQIRQGAPFQVFLSADEEYVEALNKEGKTDGEGTLYAVGRIGLFAPTGSPLKVDGELRDLTAALKDGRLQKFAIANPEHAPYGRAARAALEHAGLWGAIVRKLVLGEDVVQATQFAASGLAQGGIISLSLAKAPAVAQAGTFALIPEVWHPPLLQRMVLLKGASDTARAFYDYMQTQPAREVLKRYGFVLPGEEG